MDHIDPSRIRGCFQPPMTAEIASEAKKKFKQAKMDSFEEKVEANDIFSFSEESKQIPEKKKEAFMADAKKEIANLDPNSESFVDDATEKLVNSALKWEFGEKILKDPGFKEMENVIKKKLMRDPRYRPIIEDFLGKMLDSEE
jgi:hypothetical protein